MRGARMPGAECGRLRGAVYRARVAISQPLGAFFAPSLAALAFSRADIRLQPNSAHGALSRCASRRGCRSEN